jgi:hypothetical protein
MEPTNSNVYIIRKSRDVLLNFLVTDFTIFIKYDYMNDC